MRPAWEAMHAPSFDGPKAGRAPASNPANHLTVGPDAVGVRPSEGQP